MPCLSRLLALVLLVGCASSPQVLTPEQEHDRYFPGQKGCFLLYNLKTKSYDKTLGDASCRERLSASSTFKIPLAVMAFDSGVLKEEGQVLKWDGKKGVLESHNRDHDARSWMKESVVWFSQRITPKLGKKRLQSYLNSFNYGNKDISAGITQAWLVSPSEENALKISAVEQVEFLEKLWTDKLPVSKRAQKITRELTFLETSPKGFRLSGKTGSNFYDKNRKVRLGWFISHLEKEGHEYLAVTTFSDLAPATEEGFGGFKAKALTKTILNSLGLW